jgi:hypothetical protein
MKILDKTFKNEDQQLYKSIQQQVRSQFPDIKTCNNSYLVMDKLKYQSNNTPTVVECGVYKGGTLITTKLFADKYLPNTDLNLIGVDSFNGFPSKEFNKHDIVDQFKLMYSSGDITEDHLNKAIKRTNKLRNDQHLEEEYFKDNFNYLFRFCNKNNITLVKGYFNKVLNRIKHDIDILYIDCDLYESYMDCLKQLYDKVVDGGVVIFDEYYSLKYPGARIAVNEFFKDESGYFERYYSPEDFERWCFIKESK